MYTVTWQKKGNSFCVVFGGWNKLMADTYWKSIKFSISGSRSFPTSLDKTERRRGKSPVSFSSGFSFGYPFCVLAALFILCKLFQMHALISPSIVYDFLVHPRFSPAVPPGWISFHPSRSVAWNFLIKPKLPKISSFHYPLCFLLLCLELFPALSLFLSVS